MTTQQDMSPTIGKLAEALAKAQSTMGHAMKDASNPFFKSKYADLTSVAEACRKQLAENAIAVTQTTSMNEAGQPILVTTLMHSSGEWIKGFMPVLASKNDAQAFGSALSYARRYALAAIASVCTSDDDGEAAVGRGEDKKFQPTAKVTAIREPTAALTVTASDMHSQVRKAVEGNESALNQILEYNKVSAIEELSEDQCKRVLNSFLKHKVRGA